MLNNLYRLLKYFSLWKCIFWLGNWNVINAILILLYPLFSHIHTIPWTWVSHKLSSCSVNRIRASSIWVFVELLQSLKIRLINKNPLSMAAPPEWYTCNFKHCHKIWIYFMTSFPAEIYFLKVNNRNTRTRCEICPKLTIKTMSMASFWCLYC